jgi:hypothetical protein
MEIQVTLSKVPFLRYSAVHVPILGAFFSLKKFHLRHESTKKLKMSAAVMQLSRCADRFE